MTCPSNHENTEEDQKPDTNSEVLIKACFGDGKQRRKPNCTRTGITALACYPESLYHFLTQNSPKVQFWRSSYFSIHTDLSFLRQVCGDQLFSATVEKSCV